MGITGKQCVLIATLETKRELGPKCAPQLVLGTLMGKQRVNYWPIAQVRYIKILTRLRGFMGKIANI